VQQDSINNEKGLWSIYAYVHDQNDALQVFSLIMYLTGQYWSTSNHKLLVLLLVLWWVFSSSTHKLNLCISM
jgi:hypothetical protein